MSSLGVENCFVLSRLRPAVLLQSSRSERRGSACQEVTRVLPGRRKVMCAEEAAAGSSPGLICREVIRAPPGDRKCRASDVPDVVRSIATLINPVEK